MKTSLHRKGKVTKGLPKVTNMKPKLSRLTKLLKMKRPGNIFQMTVIQAHTYQQQYDDFHFFEDPEKPNGFVNPYRSLSAINIQKIIRGFLGRLHMFGMLLEQHNIALFPHISFLFNRRQKYNRRERMRAEGLDPDTVESERPFSASFIPPNDSVPTPLSQSYGVFPPIQQQQTQQMQKSLNHSQSLPPQSMQSTNQRFSPSNTANNNNNTYQSGGGAIVYPVPPPRPSYNSSSASSLQQPQGGLIQSTPVFPPLDSNAALPIQVQQQQQQQRQNYQTPMRPPIVGNAPPSASTAPLVDMTSDMSSGSSYPDVSVIDNDNTLYSENYDYSDERARHLTELQGKIETFHNEPIEMDLLSPNNTSPTKQVPLPIPPKPLPPDEQAELQKPAETISPSMVIESISPEDLKRPNTTSPTRSSTNRLIPVRPVTCCAVLPERTPPVTPKYATIRAESPILVSPSKPSTADANKSQREKQPVYPEVTLEKPIYMEEKPVMEVAKPAIEIDVVPVVDVLQKTNEISTQTPMEQSTQTPSDFNRINKEEEQQQQQLQLVEGQQQNDIVQVVEQEEQQQEENENESEGEIAPLVEITTTENDYQYNNYEIINMERPTGPIVLGLVQSEIIDLKAPFDEDIYRGEYKRYEPIEKTPSASVSETTSTSGIEIDRLPEGVDFRSESKENSPKRPTNVKKNNYQNDDEEGKMIEVMENEEEMPLEKGGEEEDEIPSEIQSETENYYTEEKKEEQEGEIPVVEGEEGEENPPEKEGGEEEEIPNEIQSENENYNEEKEGEVTAEGEVVDEVINAEGGEEEEEIEKVEPIEIGIQTIDPNLIYNSDRQLSPGRSFAVGQYGNLVKKEGLDITEQEKVEEEEQQQPTEEEELPDEQQQQQQQQQPTEEEGLPDDEEEGLPDEEEELPGEEEQVPIEGEEEELPAESEEQQVPVEGEEQEPTNGEIIDELIEQVEAQPSEEEEQEEIIKPIPVDEETQTDTGLIDNVNRLLSPGREEAVGQYGNLAREQIEKTEEDIEAEVVIDDLISQLEKEELNKTIPKEIGIQTIDPNLIYNSDRQLSPGRGQSIGQYGNLVNDEKIEIIYVEYVPEEIESLSVEGYIETEVENEIKKEEEELVKEEEGTKADEEEQPTEEEVPVEEEEPIMEEEQQQPTEEEEKPIMEEEEDKLPLVESVVLESNLVTLHSLGDTLDAGTQTIEITDQQTQTDEIFILEPTKKQEEEGEVIVKSPPPEEHISTVEQAVIENQRLVVEEKSAVEETMSSHLIPPDTVSEVPTTSTELSDSCFPPIREGELAKFVEKDKVYADDEMSSTTTEEYTDSEDSDYSDGSSSTTSSSDSEIPMMPLNPFTKHQYFPQFPPVYVTPYQACTPVIAEEPVMIRPATADAILMKSQKTHADKLREDVVKAREFINDSDSECASESEDEIQSAKDQQSMLPRMESPVVVPYSYNPPIAEPFTYYPDNSKSRHTTQRPLSSSSSVSTTSSSSCARSILPTFSDNETETLKEPPPYANE